MRIRGTGPIPCDVMLISDNPGREEDAKGKSLVGRVGREVDRFLNGYELPLRSDIYITSLIKQWAGENGEYTQEDIDRDLPELLGEIDSVAPSTIITLGRSSARALLGDVDMEDVHSIPWLVQDRVVFPVYNPAAGFRSPELQNAVTYGFAQCSDFLHGRLTPRKLFDDAWPTPTYIELADPKWFVCLNGVRKVYIDTEGYPHAPWSIQFAAHPGTAYLIRATEHRTVAAFLGWLARERPRVVFHSALHDRPMLRSLAATAGVTALVPALDALECDDTMVMAYLLQQEPQGLKPLCVRHAGMHMQSYDEVTGEAGRIVALEYLTALYDVENLTWEQACRDEFDARIRAGRRIKKVPQLPKTTLHKSLERCLRSKDPRKLWGDQVDDVHVAAYEHTRHEIPEPTLDLVPRKVAVHYGCRDADGTARVEPLLRERVEGLALGSTYTLEMGTYPLIDRMGTIGIQPDLAHFDLMSHKLAFEIADLQEEIVRVTGKEMFNANSGDQVADYLFGQLKLPPIGRLLKGSDRYSTNDKILEALEKEHGSTFPIISTLRSYREVFKLKNTFVDRIPDFTHRWPFDGRVHATFRTTRVVTGRLAASDPNLLAQPKHGKFARLFRRGWVPAPDHVLCSWDESQVELRVLAHLSQDPKLLEAFRTGLDLHAALAVRIFGGTEADHKKGTGRLAAKAINFGIPMGMQAQGLTVELRKNGVKVDEDDAQRWLDETMALYKLVPVYQQNKIAEARRHGFVRCLSGRIRYVGGIKSFDDYVRGEAERFAFSTPIQEGAQLVMKTAEKHVWEDIVLPFHDAGVWIEPICQIHDDLVLETVDDRQHLRELNKMMMWAMTETYQGLSVPLDTSGEAGHNWCAWSDKDPDDRDMKEIE